MGTSDLDTSSLDVNATIPLKNILVEYTDLFVVSFSNNSRDGSSTLAHKTQDIDSTS